MCSRHLDFGIDETTMNRDIKWISDRGQNLVIALTQKSMVRLSCFAHIINNIVKAMMEVCKKYHQ